MTTNQGGSHEQHVKAGEQSHKSSSESRAHEGSTRGGSSEQHAKAGHQSHKNTTSSDEDR